MATTDQFLSEISRILREKDAPQLRNYLVIEPPYAALYNVMIQEIKQSYPKGAEDALESKCESSIPEARGGGENASWTAFVKFLVQYFIFLRDVNSENLLDTYNLLSELVQKCNSALNHATLGILVLPTVISYSRTLSRLAIGLDKQPDLISHLSTQSTSEGGGTETLPERAANIIRQAFTTCLNDRGGAPTGVKDGKPDGKKLGIYKIANLCLKVLFQCRKTRNAEQMFVNIDNQSPPLSVYPRSERITYLYYLGRFLFSNNHFWRAQLALQTAYDECHFSCTKQRRLILVYLLASNIILGRFPSRALFTRPEAAGLADKFMPVCDAVRQGSLASFRTVLSFDSPTAQWLLHFRIHLQLRDRCEVLVWRSLFRKVFLINGYIPPADGRSAPTFNLEDVLQAIKISEPESLHSAMADGYCDPDLEDAAEETTAADLPDILEVESIASSLLVQGLLNGFISHRLLKFAITGAKKKKALDAGFPNVWQTIKARSDDTVPGWVKDRKPRGSFGPGTVVNLSGARAAGSGP